MSILIICQPSSCGMNQEKGKGGVGNEVADARPDKKSHESTGTALGLAGGWLVVCVLE